MLEFETIQWILQPNTPALSCMMDKKLWNSKQIRLMIVKSVILVQNEKCMYMVWCHQFQDATALSAKKGLIRNLFLKPIKKALSFDKICRHTIIDMPFTNYYNSLSNWWKTNISSFSEFFFFFKKAKYLKR